MGGATESEVRIFAQKYNVAKKTVVQLLHQLKLPVKPDPKPAVSPTKAKNYQRAEALFKSPESQTAPDESTVEAAEENPEPVDEKSEEGLAALVELEQSMRAEQEKLLGELLEAEAEMIRAKEEARQERERAEQERERAEQAIQKTKKLRVATKADREELEELKSQISFFRRNSEKADKRVAAVKAIADERVRRAEENEKWALDQVSAYMYQNMELKESNPALN